MKIDELARIVAALEGKKRQVSIGNIKEVLSVLAEVLAKDEKALKCLSDYVIYKANQKSKNRKKSK